ncbi:Ankyrin repeat domain-containing protein [Tetrabaena socialis]|uniref:Ankyrin repeat domain-containing protein n=1 Tax=Tetrabaena socialis TaxID=47790 RepID=A0A2J8ADJ8_9CHLO|nr:Ankyrin repeat domain-containing protein [Tetrabaena socialis]|eukprot:PNH10598.1 Ankyrin repeat domain-containing protein [Tetrabaena socialis]
MEAKGRRAGLELEKLSRAAKKAAGCCSSPTPSTPQQRDTIWRAARRWYGSASTASTRHHSAASRHPEAAAPAEAARPAPAGADAAGAAVGTVAAVESPARPLPLTEPPRESALLPDPQQQGEAASAAVDPSRIWLLELVQRYARSLSCNEVACALRLVNKATAAQFRGPQDRTVQLSLPVPHHAFVQRWSGIGATRSLQQTERWGLVRFTASSGSIANLEVLLAREECTCGTDGGALCGAAGAGQLEVCRWLRQQGCPWDSLSLLAAAGGGHQAVCEWLLASGCPWSEWAAGAAARGGHVGLMDWLLGTGHDSTSGSLADGVAAGCDLPTLRRLHSTHFAQQLGEYYKASVMASAAGSATVDWRAKVEWLEGQGFPRTAKACAKAVKQPDWRGRLQWLQQRGYPLDGDVAEAAANVGVVDALHYVLDWGVALDKYTTAFAAREAARGGHLAVLQALHARGFTYHLVPAVAAAAAVHRHLPVVAWLVETLGAEKVLSAELFASAAKSGKMELLAWLHGHGCPWDHNVFAYAADTGCEEQLEWLAGRGCPMGEDGEPYVWAARKGDLATLSCLQRLGCPLGFDSGSVFDVKEALELGEVNSTIAVERISGIVAKEMIKVFGRRRPAGLAQEDATWWNAECQQARDTMRERDAARRGGTGTQEAFLASRRAYHQAKRLARAAHDASTYRDFVSTCRTDPRTLWRALEEGERQRCPLADCALFREHFRTLLNAGAEQQGEAAAAAVDPSRIWLPELVQRYARSLSCNEVACALRLVNKATAAQFRGKQDRTVRLSLPAPHHAFVQRWSGLSSLTARSGSIANLEVLLSQEECACFGDEALCGAAGAGQLEVCRWLRRQGCSWDRWTLDEAAKGGHQDVCEWLLASGCPWSMEAAGKAARGGHVGLMDWLLGTGYDSHSEGLIEAAAAGCDLPTLQRLHSTHFTQQFDEYSTALVMAAAAGSLTADWRAKVEWLEGQGYPRTAMACAEAVGRPDWRGRLQWLQQRGYPLDGDVAMAATSVGVVDALQYVLEWGVTLDQHTATFAAIYPAMGGHLAVLQALHARGFDIAGAATAAAEEGHLPIVAWLVEALGAEKVLSAELFASAAESGNMELLVWLHDRGCPWDESVFSVAGNTGCEEQLEWLAARGCPMGDGEPYAWAARNGDLATLRCLQHLGCPLGPDSGGVFVEWLEGQGFPQSAEACAAAVRQPDWRGRLEWLQQRGYPLDGDVATAAARVGVVDALHYVLDSGVTLDQHAAKWAAISAAMGGHLAEDGEPYAWAAGEGDLATLSCLQRLGCTLGPESGGVFVRAILHSYGNEIGRSMLRLQRGLLWLVERIGTLVDWNAAERAVQSMAQQPERDKLLTWLRAQRAERV